MGIDDTRFVDEIHKQFECPVCLQVIEDPILTPCDHHFCRNCFQSDRCYVCRTHVKEIKPLNRISRKIYESLRLKCSFEGCNQEITLVNMKTHESSCPLQEVKKLRNEVVRLTNEVTNLKKLCADNERAIAQSNEKITELQSKNDSFQESESELESESEPDDDDD